MMNFILICFLAIADVNGGIGGMAFGFNHQFGVKDINNSISAYTPEFRENYFSIGGYGFGIIHGFIVGGGGFSTNTTTSSDSMKIDLDYTTGGFQTGIVIPIWKIYGIFTLGMGGSVYTMKISPVSNISTYNDILNNPEKFSIISISSKNISLGISLLFPIFHIAYIGINSTYYFSLPTSDWEFEGDLPITGGPDVNLSSYSVSLTITFGNIEKGEKNGK